MKREILKEVGRAAYNARKELMLTGGGHTDRVVHTPDTLHFYNWDEIPERLSKPVQEVFCKEAEAAIGAFFNYILVDGTPEAKQAIHTLLRDETLLSGEEGGERQDE